MPLSTMIVLYSMSVLAGAVLVVYGLASGRGRKAASPARGSRSTADALTTAAEEVVALRFLDENVPLEEPLPGVSRRERRRLSSNVAAEEGGDAGNRSKFSGILAAPFRALTRRKSGEPGIERPVSSPIHLDARIPDAAGETRDPGKPPPASDTSPTTARDGTEKDVDHGPDHAQKQSDPDK